MAGFELRKLLAYKASSTPSLHQSASPLPFCLSIPCRKSKLIEASAPTLSGPPQLGANVVVLLPQSWQPGPAPPPKLLLPAPRSHPPQLAVPLSPAAPVPPPPLGRPHQESVNITHLKKPNRKSFSPTPVSAWKSSGASDVTPQDRALGPQPQIFFLHTLLCYSKNYHHPPHGPGQKPGNHPQCLFSPSPNPSKNRQPEPDHFWFRSPAIPPQRQIPAPITSGLPTLPPASLVHPILHPIMLVSTESTPSILHYNQSKLQMLCLALEPPTCLPTTPLTQYQASRFDLTVGFNPSTLVPASGPLHVLFPLPETLFPWGPTGGLLLSDLCSYARSFHTSSQPLSATSPCFTVFMNLSVFSVCISYLSLPLENTLCWGRGLAFLILQ